MINGNKDTNDYSLLDVFMTAKQNTMRDIHCSEIGKIVEKKSDYEYIVTLINNDKQRLICFNFCGSQLNLNDIVLIVFTDTDNRTNLDRILKEINTQNLETIDLHSLEYGIIINKLQLPVQE